MSHIGGVRNPGIGFLNSSGFSNSAVQLFAYEDNNNQDP